MASLLKDAISSKPTDVLIGATYKCNSRCEMCNIWKDDTLREIPSETYNRLPESLTNITIVGGETLMYTELIPTIEKLLVKHPKAYFTISTHGL